MPFLNDLEVVSDRCRRDKVGIGMKQGVAVLIDDKDYR